MRATTKSGVLLTALGLCCTSCGGGGGSDAPPPPNRAPVVANPNATIRPVAQHAFHYDVAQSGVFTDPDGDPLTYSITLSSANAVNGMTVSGTTVTGLLSSSGSVAFSVIASDGRGGSVGKDFEALIVPNSPPTVARSNLAIITQAGAHVNYDPTQGGTTFTDADGDALTYEVTAISPSIGLSIQGTQIIGTLSGLSSMTFYIVAHDAYAGFAEERFVIAAAAPEPGRPSLPATSYTYDDYGLSLPRPFIHSRENFGPFWDTTPLNNPTTDAGATLGRVLFYDKRLSVTNTHSCSSCHVQQHAFTEPKRFSVGVPGTPLRRNTMGLGNVRHNFDSRYFTDRRVFGLESLALLPIEEPTELANTLQAVEEKLARTDFYPPLFTAAFGTPEVTRERIAKALAQFLRSLLSYRSKFDLAFGDVPSPQTVFTAEELRGFEIFDGDARCSLCHEDRIQILDFPENNGIDAVFTDPGSGDGVFRAASLRNIALTAPYMHDGRFATLREVIDHYDHGVQPSTELSRTLRETDGTPRRLNLSEADKDALEAFLNTLSDFELIADPRFSDPFQ